MRVCICVSALMAGTQATAHGSWHLADMTRSVFKQGPLESCRARVNHPFVDHTYIFKFEHFAVRGA